MAVVEEEAGSLEQVTGSENAGATNGPANVSDDASLFLY